jgi:glycosyltransferase involved in cell wall biosynthesis
MGSVDIAIPCYNYGRYLKECVESVLSQGIENVRILIVDNASTDGSQDIARALAAEHAAIELLLREQNAGPHASFNAGVDWAAGDYFMVLCADDLLAPGSLRRSVSVMDANPSVAFTYGADVHWIGERARPEIAPHPGDDWKILSGDAWIEEKFRNLEQYFAVGMILTRTAAHKKAGHYRKELAYADDLEVALRLARLGDVARTGAVQGIRRFHEANQTWTYVNQDRTRDLRELLAAAESFVAHEGPGYAAGPRLLKLGRRCMAERAYFAGLADLVRNRPSYRGLFAWAFELDPSTRFLPPVSYLARHDRPLIATALNIFGLKRQAA